MKRRNQYIGNRILGATGGSALLAFLALALALTFADIVEVIKSGEPESPIDSRSMNRLLELTSHWVGEIRNSHLGVSEVMSITAISTALVLAVSLRSRNARDGTVDEEARFIWLRLITIAFCLLGAAVSWGLAAAQDWLKPGSFMEGLIMVVLAVTGSGLAAVVGDSIYSLTRAKQQATLRKNRLSETIKIMRRRASKSKASDAYSTFAWPIFGALLPVTATVITSFWGIERRQGNSWEVVQPTLFIAMWCLYVWYFRSKLFDLTDTKRRYLTLHIFVAVFLALPGFLSVLQATWSIPAASTIWFLTYLLPWLIMLNIDKNYPVFMTARLKTINKEIAHLNGDIFRLQQSIKAHGPNLKLYDNS